MKRILFVCTGNSCRSVMAEGLFRKIMEGRANKISCSSAGISAMDGFPSTEETIRAMKEEGVDVSGHQSRRLTQKMIQNSDKIFVMEKIHKDWVLSMDPQAKDKVHLLAEYASTGDSRMPATGIPDPIRMSDQFYRNVLNVIYDCVKNVAEDL